jgi:uncharacterized protein
MLSQPTISGTPPADPGLDQAALFALGMEQIRTLSGAVWSDHNTHDPGITILELATYALTDLTYRANFPLEDLLATKADNAASMAGQFFTSRQVLHNRAWTEADYRKLIIDLPDVKNAWLRPNPLRFVADPVKGILRHNDPNVPLAAWERPVELRGLYDVVLEFADGFEAAKRAQIIDTVRALLNANRSLGQDFVNVSEIETERYSLCAEIELEPDADPTAIAARVLFEVDQYLAPTVLNYDLETMRQKRHEDGAPYTLAEIFAGPRLKNGFIDDRELAAAQPRTEIRLSDIISIIMDLPGVRAVRDIVVNALRVIAPDKPPEPVEPADKWRLAVAPGKQPRLHESVWRLVFSKRNLPTPAPRDQVIAAWVELKKQAQKKVETAHDEDVKIPEGRFRDVGRYHSFQHHFPVVFGLSDATMPPKTDTRRYTQVLQLKAYLLFFDQVMANFLAQLANIRELFSRDPDQTPTYFTQLVTSFLKFEEVYPPFDANNPGLFIKELGSLLENETGALARRNRFLDHLLARFAEDFHDYVRFLNAGPGAETGKQAIQTKCDFLNDIGKQTQGSERGLAYNHALTGAADLWNSANVSGLERRLARLLGIQDITRRDLSGNATEAGEGLFLIENILLRPSAGEVFLPICPDPSCEECFDDDPYSYRLQIILPAYSERFKDMEFRRFVEETIRLEVPAHLLPKICWVDVETMKQVESKYKAWLEARAGGSSDARRAALGALIEALGGAKNIYPPQKLHGCDDETKPPFILNRNALGDKKT